MAKRQTPDTNAGSMADIAFLLLIFFLVTTTMDVDSGIARKLPPIEETQEETNVVVKERNVFIVLINRNNDLLVEGIPTHITQLREKTKEFVLNPNNNEDLSEGEEKQFDFVGVYRKSKGVVSLQNDRGTQYEIYIQVQNELTKAYNELRDELAMQKFGKKYDNCPEEYQEVVREIFPLAISEAEPRDVGK